MMVAQVVDLLTRRAGMILSGALEGPAAQYALPTPVFFHKGRTVLRDREDCRKSLEWLRNDLRARGVVALRPGIAAIDLPRGGRFRVWVDWVLIDAQGQESPGSSVIYYCRKDGAGIALEMLDYRHMSSPAMRPMFMSLPLSA